MVYQLAMEAALQLIKENLEKRPELYFAFGKEMDACCNAIHEAKRLAEEVLQNGTKGR